MAIPTVSIDLDKKCSQCGKKGATESGLCLKCITKRITKKITKRKAMMLNKLNFEIAKLASKNDEASPALKGILVAPDKTAVTDGHLVLELTGFEHSGDILPFDEFKPQQDFEAFIMPAEEALTLSKVFIKSDSPDANLIGIDPQDGGRISSFGLRQPRSEKVFRVDKPADQFPNYDLVFPDIKEEVASVTVNADLLIALLQQMAKVDFAVRIGLYGPEKMIRFDCMDRESRQSAKGGLMPILMPMRA